MCRSDSNDAFMNWKELCVHFKDKIRALLRVKDGLEGWSERFVGALVELVSVGDLDQTRVSYYF